MLSPIQGSPAPSAPSTPPLGAPVAPQPPVVIPPPPSRARGLLPQVAMFGGGVLGLLGVFEGAAPLIHLAGTVDPHLVFPARMGAAAAIGAGGATAIVLMETSYQATTKAKLESLDHGTPFTAELMQEAAEQRTHVPKEIMRAAGIAAGAGAALGGLVAYYPTQVLWTLAGAVALSLSYSVGSLAVHGTKALSRFRRARKDMASGDMEAAKQSSSAGRQSLQKAGLAAIDAVTVVAVTHHMAAEVAHLLDDSGHQNGAKVVASSAEQIGGAMESVGEVAEALGIGAREAAEAAVAVRQARFARALTGIGLPGSSRD